MTKEEKIKQLKLKLKENNKQIELCDGIIENCFDGCIARNLEAQELEEENKKIIEKLERLGIKDEQ